MSVAKKSKGHEMKSSHSSGRSLIIACQSSKASHPGKRALHDPSTRQQDKASSQPMLRLLIHGMPRWQVMGNHPPGNSCSHHATHRVIHFLQVIVPLPGIFGQQRQIRSDEGLFFVAYITWVWLSGHHAIIPLCFLDRVPNTTAPLKAEKW
jgi:hypothetical protein